MRSFLDFEPTVAKEIEEDILVVNRVHPDECYIGDQVDQVFADGPIPGVRLITRDIPEDAREQRGLIPGNNTALLQGNPNGDPDEQFLWKIKEAAQHAKVVLDVHGHKGHGGTASYPFYGELGRHNPVVLGIASLLRSEKALIHPISLYLAASIPTYMGWDLALGTDVKALRPILEKLGAGWCPPIRPMTEFSYVCEVSAADGAKYGFEEEYGQFEPLPATAVAKLGLPQGSHASGWSASLYSHTGLWGEVVVPRPKKGV
jgi:hypothetical protein